MGNQYKIGFRIFLMMFLFAAQLKATTLYVLNTNDAGAGSFRAVLQAALAGDVIQFNIPGAGPHVIQPLTSYVVTKQITIDGLNAGKPGVEFDGNICSGMTCFDFNSVGGSGTIIQGLAINGFRNVANAAGILITQATGVTVKSCYLGTDITGTVAKPNNTGVFILGSSDNIIGGPLASDGNLLSGNTIRGAWISGQGGVANNNTVENNKVGMDINGNPMPNFTGVEYQLNANNNLVQHNIISYNTGDGLSFNQQSTGNRIYGNVFSYNGEHGVDLLNNTVTDNVVGVSVSGVGEPNAIFNNGQAGVFISEWYNDGAGVYQGGSPSRVTVRQNLIYCNGVEGIALTENPGSAAGNSAKAKPVINLASTESNTFGKAAPGDVIDIYSADGCNTCGGGNSQGQTWLASVIAAGDGSWSYTKVGGAQCNSLVVTATDALGNTSEFAAICTRPSVSISDTSTCTTVSYKIDATKPCVLSYKWSTGATTPSVDLVNALPGLYWVEVKGQDNVAVRDTFEILQKTLPDAVLSDAQFCEGDSLTMNPGVFTTYKWSDASTGNTLKVKTAGVYWVVVTNAEGCKDSTSATISINALPAGTIADASVCAGGNVTINAGTWISYLWDNGSTAASTAISTTGQHWVIVENNKGCEDSLFVQVNPGSDLTVSLNNPSPVCSDGPVTLTATVSGTPLLPLLYNWNGSAGTENLLISSSGKYKVIVTDAGSCKGSDSVDVVYPAVPQVDLGKDTSLCFSEGKSFKIAVADTFASVVWMNSSSSSSIDVNSAQEVVVTVSNGSCFASDTIVVSEKCTSSSFHWDFPNWVTPNNDGFNDRFYPKYVNDSTLGKIKSINFVVYDRWGVQMLERSEVAEIPQWDATYLGKPVAPGVYYWIVQWTDIWEGQGEANGWMEVMKSE
ncbi:MAG: gliding motility-associated C-terminal domain-containing protein [Flavobacteriales bacterium]